MASDDRENLEPTKALTDSWWAEGGDQGLSSPAQNKRVGPFELVDFLGRGGMGEVYKARDHRLDREIALKLLLPGPQASEERFQREARAQAKIDDDGVCQVYEVGTADGRAYIAMQFIEGETLAEVAAKLTLEEKVSVVHQVAKAVHAAHRQALVHRDLKPGNIMVQRTDDGLKAWVLDFGMVHVIDDAPLTMTGEVVGTPHYMSPEQVMGDIAGIDRRTDVYSLGAVLYELLTGQPPITGKNVIDVLRRITFEDPVLPRQLRPSIPEDLEWIALRCLEKDAGRRYGSAATLIRDLERFRAGEPVQARQVTWRYRWSKRVRKHRRLLLVAGALTVLLAGAIWRDLSQRRDAAETARLALRHFQDAKEAGVGDSAWARALLATYEGRWDAALEAMDEAEAESPWRHEIHTLRGKVWHEQSRESVENEDYDQEQVQLAKAVEALAEAHRMGESDSEVYSTLCDVNNTRFFAFEGVERTAAENRSALLEPCLQAMIADSGSANARTMAAVMAETLAIQLLWHGDGEARTYFEQSVAWAQQAIDLDPDTFRAVNLLSRSLANLGSLSESVEERDELLDRALAQAWRLVTESRRELAEIVEKDPKRIRIPLLETVADRIETELNSADNPALTNLATTTGAEIDSHIGWDTLLAQPYLQSEVRWWRAYLEGWR